MVLLVLLPLLVVAPPAQAYPAYTWSSRPIDAQLQYRMRYSYRAGCPVPLRDLRYVNVKYVSWFGHSLTGELVVHRDAVATVADAFRRMYDARFAIRRMKLVDAYKGSDDASMYDDNTSAFNCRPVAGTSRWSLHAYGRAIDINPVENPYVTGGKASPPNGQPYVDRRPRKGVVNRTVVEAFRRHGWGWGGYWSGAKDWQHFSRSGT